MDALTQDTILILKDSTPSSNMECDVWLYIAIAEFIIILLLLSFKGSSKKNKRTQLKEKILSENNVDFANVVNSSFQAKALYDELKAKCHPDKFKDEQLNAEATEIFSLLVKHKYDYKKLQELKVRAIKELNIS